MIGVAQDYLGFHLFAQLAEVYAFHAAARSYRHEYRSPNLSVPRSNEACACVAGVVSMLYFEKHSSIFDAERYGIFYFLVSEGKVPYFLYVLDIMEVYAADVFL